MAKLSEKNNVHASNPVVNNKKNQPVEKLKDITDLTMYQLSSPQFHNEPTSIDDDTAFKEAYGFIAKGDIDDNYDNAIRVIKQNLPNCGRKDRLCELLGNIFLNRQYIESIGWYMQACILGSDSWVPYLMTCYTAKIFVLTAPLSRRCMYASEILCAPAMKRMDDIEVQIVSMIRGPHFNTYVIEKSLNAFERFMDPYLPSDDKFSLHKEERAAYYKANSGMFESDDFKSIRKRLLER